ncbi:MAG: TatD family hydrolase [Elusimicrobia bacterium]|nr:TatD family hydrolase [Elusimicrobiota bacterium]MBI2915818.1 TatD family hydrolase [Elusimicrobiota bacterium]
MLVDTHTHLCDTQFDLDRESVLQRAKENGLRTIVEIAESPEVWERAQNFSERFPEPFVYWACGYHPHYAGQVREEDFSIMKERLSHPRCVAVGEVGLDYAKSAASREEQISLFRRTLESASESGKPVVVHCRDAQADTLRLLKSFFGGLSRRELCAGVIHCFSGDLSFAQGCLDLGFYLGVDGPITYPSAKSLREVIAQVPLDRIVLETDSPYLPPQPFRGKRNESGYVTFVAEKLAELFSKSVEDISTITTQNADRLFRIKS